VLRTRSIAITVTTVALLTAGSAWGQTCSPLTADHAAASAGTPNINHDGTPLPGTAAPDISKGFQGIPRSAQPALTESQQRILECTYTLGEANADMPYTLFVPSRYKPGTPTPLVVDLHGLNITPLQQILFDGTTDFAERYGFIVVAPMGFNVSAGWGGRVGSPIETAQAKPGSDVHYSASELAELDATTLLKRIREQYTVDADRIFLMGHSLGGAGTYYLGGKYNDIWAGLAPLSGAGGIADAAAAAKYKSIPMLIMHGEKDSIVPAATSRRAVAALQSIGAPHIYLEFPGKDHEFWIRRGAENMEKVFLFFSMLSKGLRITPTAVPALALTPAAAQTTPVPQTTAAAPASVPVVQPAATRPPCAHPHYTQMYDGQFMFSCYEEPQALLMHVLITGGVALQGSDAMQTAYVLGNGGGHELNPVLQPFSSHPAAFGAMKLGLVAVSTWGLVKLHAQPGKRARWITIAILAEEYAIETWCITHNERVLRDLRQ